MKSEIIRIEGKFHRPSALIPLAYTVSFSTASVIAASIGSAACTYILVAITGYLSFGNSVLGNIVGMCK